MIVLSLTDRYHRTITGQLRIIVELAVLHTHTTIHVQQWDENQTPCKSKCTQIKLIEITKTNTPLPLQGLGPILIAPPHTYIAYTTHAAISFVNQCYTVSTPDASGTTKYYRSPYNQWCCLHWMLRSATNPRQKTAAAFCLWCADTNFKWFSTIVLSRSGRHQWCGVSSVDTVLLTYREQTKQPQRPITDLPLLEFSPALESWSDIYTGPVSCLIVPQMFSALVFIRHLYLSVTRLGCSLNALSSISRVDTPLTCWLATSLFWYSAPTPFSKAFKKNDIPHL